MTNEAKRWNISPNTHSGMPKLPAWGIDSDSGVAARIAATNLRRKIVNEKSARRPKWKQKSKNGGAVMKGSLFVAIFTVFIGGFFATPLRADDTLARFKGGIGVHPVSNVSGTAVTQNIVRGVTPAGQLWVIEDLDARVRMNGDIKIQGKGLILAGGNSAGRTTGQIVFATLICEAAAPFTERNTNPMGVPLAANGDFKIDDVLTPLPAGGCASPMLLIRSTSAGTSWFAVGILSPD